MKVANLGPLNGAKLPFVTLVVLSGLLLVSFFHMILFDLGY